MWNVDDVWDCDLLQLTSIKEINDGYSYLLVVVDVLNKDAWVVLLGRFQGPGVPNLLRKWCIPFETVRNPDIKAAIVDEHTKCYTDIVQKIIYAYNHTVHTGTKLRPAEVNLNNAKILSIARVDNLSVRKLIQRGSQVR